jgi:hypothetical protein
MRNWILAAAVLLSFSSTAEIKQTLGDWDVHYIAIPTATLRPDIARQYGIKRSKYNAFVNISVLDKETQKAVKQVYLTGEATNLLGQTRQLSFQKITEENAIYHIAQLPINHEDHWRFKIRVNQTNHQELLKFEQKFYVD